MSSKLPIAIVIPHSGLAIPSELTDRVALTEAQIFNEADVYTDLIYDFQDHVEYWEVFPYARSIIDVNRPNQEMSQLPIPKGDGIVKRYTSYGTQVYHDGQEPDATLEQHLIESYWQAWHVRLAEIAADENIKLVLDCHSMAATGPSHYAGAAQRRPRISTCNFGDESGEAFIDGISITASPELTIFIGQKFGEALTDISDLAPVSQDYTINKPFIGGANLYMHGKGAQPWLMIELSRATYIGEQTGDSAVVPPNKKQITLIREKLWSAIVEIVESL